MSRLPRGDKGNALVEFTYLGVLLMVPLVYLLITVFQVQSAAFGVTEAARQAARAYARADSVAQAQARAALAAQTALADQGIDAAAPPVITCAGGACLDPGSTVRVSVRYAVPLPLIGAFLPAGRGVVPVTATSVQVVDRFRQSRP